MARYTTLTFTTATAGPGGSCMSHPILDFTYSNIYKIKVEPSVVGGTSVIEIYKNSSLAAGKLLYKSGEFPETLVDPGENSLGTIYERSEGYLFPYEDEDEEDKIHIKITNNDSQSKTYTVTIVYEESVLLFNPRTLGNPRNYADLHDTQFWVPNYAPSELVTTVENVDGTIQFAPAFTGSMYMTQNISSYILSRFDIMPDSNGLIKLRINFPILNFWGSGYATRLAAAVIGLQLKNFTLCNGMMLRNSRNTDNQLLVGFFSGGNRGFIENYSEYYVSINGVGPGDFSGELICQWGLNQKTGTNYKRYGIDATASSYSINGAAHTLLGGATSQPPFTNSYSRYLQGAVIFAGFLIDDDFRNTNIVKMLDIEVIKGFTANVM